MKWKEWRLEAVGPVTRVEAVDLFRFFVLFFMIQGHLFRAYLLPAIRQAQWYKIHEVLHGFVAPGFLFAAGFTAFLSFHNKRQNYIHLDRAFFKRLRRILFVVAIGYWIHLPFLSLRKTLEYLRLGQAGDFLKVDILQCIGIGLLLFTLLAVSLKNERVVVLATALAAALFFLLPDAVKGIRIHPAVDPYFPINQATVNLAPEQDKVRVALETMTPNFKRYEARIDGGAWAPTESRFLWGIHAGTNRLELRTVNQFGVEGPASTVEVEL